MIILVIIHNHIMHVMCMGVSGCLFQLLWAKKRVFQRNMSLISLL